MASCPMTYDEWIHIWRVDHPQAAGSCAHAVQEMVKVFPELKAVRGRALIPGVGGFTCFEYDPEALKEDHPPISVFHWWCMTPDGDILDPTADQFREVFQYLPDYQNPTIRELFASFPARLQFSDPTIARALKDAFAADVDESTLVLDPDEEFPGGFCRSVRVSATFKDVEGIPHVGNIVFTVSMEDGLLTLQIEGEDTPIHPVVGVVH